MQTVSTEEEALKDCEPLVKLRVKNYAAKLPAHIEWDDLYQEGMIAVMKAWRKFDASKGVKFRTFAGKCIDGALIDYLRSTDHVGRPTRSKIKEIRELVRIMQHRLGRNPTDDEVAREYGISLKEFYYLQTVNHNPVSLIEDKPLENKTEHGDQQATTEDKISFYCKVKERDVIDILMDKQRRTLIDGQIRQLSPADQKLLSLVYDDEKTILGISREYDLGVNMVRNRHDKIIKYIAAEIFDQEQRTYAVS